MLSTPPCWDHSMSAGGRCTADGSFTKLTKTTKITKITKKPNGFVIFVSFVSFVMNTLESVKLLRVFPQHHPRQFRSPRACDFTVADHAGEGDRQGLARGLRGDPARFLPADLLGV